VFPHISTRKLFVDIRLCAALTSFVSFIIALNHKNATSGPLDETTLSTANNLAMDYKASRQSSASSNNLLKHDNNLWGTSMNDVESMRNKSQSISNIAGKVPLINFRYFKKKTKFPFFYYRNCS
jgi:hypothetical protein